MPDFLKILFILGGIILLIRLKVALSLTLLVSAVVLGFLFRLSPAGIGGSILKALLDPENVKLIVSLQLILLFSAIMKENGSMTRAITALRQIFRDARVTVALIPAIIGLVPIMGGAMLSAPLVSEASDELELSPERRTFLNFWFRHVWEYTLPTFSTIFLTASIVGCSIADLTLANLPLTIASITAGILFGFRGIKSTSRLRSPLTLNEEIRFFSRFVGNLSPFFLVILFTLYFKIHLAYSLALVTAAILLLYRFPFSLLKQLGRKNLSLELAFLIWAIMIFKEILLVSGAMDSTTKELAEMGMPPAVLIVLLPSLISFITGYPTAFVGLSFPVLLPFIQSSPMGLYYVMLALGSGLSAHLLSPMHVCLVMTLQYYNASMAKVYRLLIAPVAMLFLTGAVVAGVAFWMGR
jgi:integral membrane protein (TIGR00529 family)